MSEIAYAGAYDDPDRYDLVYSWYREDLDFYVGLARAARGPVLEAACGTGRVLLPALAAGADIDGFDLDERMLQGLRRKAAARGLAPYVVQGDLIDFTMPRRYALILIPFRAFMHVDSTDDQIRSLRCLREHLEPGGTLVFNLFGANYEQMAERERGRFEVRRFPDPEGGREIVLYATTRYDRVNQRLHAKRDIEDGAGAVIGHDALDLRWTFRWEMELLLRASGFARWDVRGGFDGRPLASDRDEMVWTAWKD